MQVDGVKFQGSQSKSIIFPSFYHALLMQYLLKILILLKNPGNILKFQNSFYKIIQYNLLLSFSF